MASPDSSVLDVLIIGGGPAALAAALTLARQLHTSVVFDSASYRNGKTPHMHTLPTWDHKPPAAFRAAARANILETYSTVQFVDTEVSELKAADDGLFAATDVTGKTWVGRKVVLATGVVDVLPELEGYAECWVKGIFHCLFCHGYEERNADSSGVLAIGDLANPMPALHFARNALQLTPNKVTIYTDGAHAIGEALEAAVADSKAVNMKVDNRKILRLEKGATAATVILHFDDGSSVTEGFLGHKPKCALKGPFATQLNLELTPQGDLKALPPFYQTSLRGVFSAGDAAGPVKITNHALFSGAAAGAGVSAQLQAEKWGQKGMI